MTIHSPTYAIIVKRPHPGSLGFESVEEREAQVGDDAAKLAVSSPTLLEVHPGCVLRGCMRSS